MSAEDLLIPRVLKTLLSKAVSQMDFWVHGMHISAGGYLTVWYYISQGSIKVKLDRLGSHIPKGAEAAYEGLIHTLWLRRDTYGSRPAERSAILHECTHALRDIMQGPAFKKEGMYGSKIKGQLHFDDEAAAYIAEALFYIYDNDVERPIDMNADEQKYGSAIAIFSTANEIAGGLKGRMRAVVKEEDFADLKQKISLDPINATIAGPTDPDDSGRW